MKSEKILPLAVEQFVAAAIAALAPHGDPALRAGMRAYMRDRFDFLGVQTPARRAATAALIRAQKDVSAADLLRYARALWELPEREYQYAAVDLLMRHARKLNPAHIAALLRLAQKKSWWDTVDALAAVVNRIVCASCEAGPAGQASVAQASMDAAIASGNLWVRRVALLHQLGWRERTDSERLFAYVAACAHEEEFFIRKAIGWALRDYARHAPEAVRAFLRANADRLSPLSIREAGKHL
jgi:3-methyladenine DNA glycosylase AlkD